MADREAVQTFLEEAFVGTLELPVAPESRDLDNALHTQ